MAADTPPDPYVKGWHDCAETIARLCELKANSLLADRSSLRNRITAPALAAIYRHAAEIARATTSASGQTTTTPPSR
jgi:hypothetical protein